MRRIMDVARSAIALDLSGSARRPGRTDTHAMDTFLRKEERRAYAIALIAAGQHQDALDIVQNAMLDLYRKYHRKPAEEWGPLFRRILHSRINDWHRRRMLHRRYFTAWFRPREDDPEMESAYAAEAGMTGDCPASLLVAAESGKRFVRCLRALPLRQKQAFMLRVWDGRDTAETAAVMGCSAGSVKTHLSRAMEALKDVLEADHD